MSDEYKFGIEEEYFLVDAGTKSVAREMPQPAQGSPDTRNTEVFRLLELFARVAVHRPDPHP